MTREECEAAFDNLGVPPEAKELLKASFELVLRILEAHTGPDVNTGVFSSAAIMAALFAYLAPLTGKVPTPSEDQLFTAMDAAAPVLIIVAQAAQMLKQDLLKAQAENN